MKILQYAQELKRSLGHHRAMYIAEARMRATAPDTWNSLPYGPIFYSKDRKGAETLPIRQLNRTHSFWTQVFHILKKELK